MAMAPVIGVLLGGVLALIVTAFDAVAPRTPLTSLLIAVLCLAALAYVTRALHLDGLADTADALGSGRPAAQALEIARRSDIGPFGVVTLTLTLGLQVVALAVAIDAGSGAVAAVTAVVAGRIALAWACTPAFAAARPDGLGIVVAGTVPVAIAIAWTVVLVAVLAWWQATWTWALVAAALGAAVVLFSARRRLGGVTGDVLGATVEIATAACLVAIAVVA